jgi:hypothetical protein
MSNKTEIEINNGTDLARRFGTVTGPERRACVRRWMGLDFVCMQLVRLGLWREGENLEKE